MTKPRRPGPKKIIDLIRPALEPVVAKRGLTQASLLLDWALIAGEHIAALCQPARLQWPPRGPKTDLSRIEPATLWLRVAAGRGLDVQYQAPVIVERVNAHFGWRCVGKVSIRPEPMPVRTRPAPPPLPGPDLVARAEARVTAIDDEGLKRAMTRLGAAVMSDAGRNRRK